MIPRLIEERLWQTVTSLRKVILLMGARQVGKTTLLNLLGKRLAADGKRVRQLNCDIGEELQVINTTSRTLLDSLTNGVDALLLDEVQRLDNPGLTLKLLYDLYPSLAIIATGSSSFELRNRTSEALTGRYIDFTLYPLSVEEMLAHQGYDNLALAQASADAVLPQILRYGLYPEIALQPELSHKELLLAKITESYLFKDILSFQQIRLSQTIVDLAKALAYQIGSEVNEHELSNRLMIDRKTVVSYLDILEKSFVITRLPAFTRNPRREIGRNKKLYFLDLGIRNALIGDFNDPALRPDRGALWENFLVVERLKRYANRGQTMQGRFWRTYQGAEVDYIEELAGGELRAFEFKQGTGGLHRGAASFRSEYATDVQLINQTNYIKFITGIDS